MSESDSTPRSPREIEIVVRIDPDNLTSVDDKYLAFLWHASQWNPAPFGDPIADSFTQKVGWEIISRWLAGQPAEMYKHQATHGIKHWLAAFAKYQPPPGVDSGDRDWHRGRWGPRPPDEVRQELSRRGFTDDKPEGDDRG